MGLILVSLFSSAGTFSGSAAGAVMTLSAAGTNIDNAVALTVTNPSLTVTKSGSGSGTVTSGGGAINCGATCSDTYTNGTPITLTAAPAAGSQFTGWLGPCTGVGACQFTINGTTTAVATFAPAMLGAPTLDIDGDTNLDAPTDGLLVFRYLFGLAGAALIDGAVGPDATRTTADEIGDYLVDIRPALDIDGDGQIDALTDGLLIVRYLSGLRGANLIAGAVAPGAIRTTDTEIEAALTGFGGTGTGLPPDPATIAPPTDPTVATTLATATAFLYTGVNPIQTGVAPGTIMSLRAAVLRGKVLTGEGAALSGVRITILDHPELGQTLSRADGMFDIAVNGGGLLTVNYAKAGLLTAQRQVNAPWQDYAVLPDVILIPLDLQVTTVDLTGSAPLQTARGSVMTDADGSRQATLLIPTGTQAQLVLPNGTTQPITTLNTRATEYTVGPNGPKAMPGELPPSSAYTYAVELSADEAIAAGAKEIRFSSPVPFYVENFLAFPVGTLVPTGFYDRSKGRWEASDNGRVIKVLSITSGLAELDVDGSSTAAGAAALAALGITDAERQRLATLYASGQSLWRVLLPHLTPWDCNFPWGPDPDSKPPSGNGSPKPGPKPDKPPKGGPCKKGGSIIGCEHQTLAEAIQITGTPLNLQYQSDRVPGRRATRTLKIRLSGATLPTGLQRIHLEIAIAGREFRKNFAPQPNLFDTFIWDGNDAYGRPVQGRQPVKLRVGYEYLAKYYTTLDTFAASFNRFGSPPIAAARGGGSAVVFSLPDTRSTTPPIILWQDYAASLGSLDSFGVGGWSPSVHHVYDVVDRTLYLGNGDQRSAEALDGAVITTAAGTGGIGSTGDGGPATQAKTYDPRGVAVRSDGAVYIADTYNNRIRRIGPDGIITTVAGTGITGFTGDGGPATQAQMTYPWSIAFGAGGSLYIADAGNSRVRRLGPDGIITTVAGTGAVGVLGDGGPATQAKLESPLGVAVGPDGSVYIADQQDHRIRRVGPDGIITTVAGTGNYGFSGDGGLATLAQLSFPQGVAAGPDGSLYIADSNNLRIRRVGPDGIITTVAGKSSAGIGFSGDGGLATQAQLSVPQGVAVGSDGSLYIAHFYNSSDSRIRRVGPDGIITTMAGTSVYGFAGDGGLAKQAQLKNPWNIAVGPDGSLFVADSGNNRIRQLLPPLPGLSVSDIFIAADDASELYVFTAAGRHLRTVDALTGAVRFQFAYDGAGRLTTFTDGSGNVTTIERDGSGNPSAIVAPFGQRTTLAVQGDGYLSSVTNPAGESVQFTYNTGAAAGLLATLTDPRGNVHQFLYDDPGRLIRDENPAGGVQILARTDITDDRYSVTVTSALALVTTYEVEELSTGDTRRVRIDPSGAHTELLLRADGSRMITYPDGTVANLITGADPRFGVQAPILKSLTVTRLGGPTTTRSATRTATLSDPNNVLSLTAQTETVTLNGHVFTSTYNAATKTITTTTPTGRQSVTTLDALSRIVSEQGDAAFGLAPLVYTYDSQGRLTQFAQGAQSWTYGYDAHNRLTSRADATGGSITYAYDAADRVSQVTLPGGRAYGLGHDASGNRTQVTMPSLDVHLLDYTPVDLESSYVPPGSNPYVTARDMDGRVTSVTLPSGRMETFSSDSGNRPAGIGYPEAAVVVAYAAGDLTARISSLTRTPSPPGPSQAVAFTYSGNVVTGTTLSGAAQGQYAYTYDSNLLLTSMALTSGADTVTTALTRDNDGLRTGLGPFTIARAGPAGAPSQVSDGTLVITNGYDTLGRISSRTHTVGGVQKYALQLTYDTVGRITTKAETVVGVAQTHGYAYDAASQLTQHQRDAVIAETHTYDANGNRTSRQLGANPVETATYDSQDRLLQRGAVAYQFNADGYLTQRGANTFQYSTTGELLQAVVGGQAVTYAYDGLRRRVSRTDVAGMTQYLYGNPDNDLQVSHTRSAAGVLTTYYYDDGRRLFALQRGAARYYVATDQVGSPRIVTDAAGTPVKVVEYGSFGDVTQDSNPGFELPIGFAGGLGDDATGFVRFGLRDYDPVAGRWTARDPALFHGGQANLYAYASNNPVNMIDPVGLGSAGVGLCEGVCVGLKLGFVKTPDGWGISACIEGGFGVGNSVDIEPFGDLDGNGMSTEAKLALKGGIAKVELGVDVPANPCGDPLQLKPKAEACVGPLCANTSDEGKLSFEPDEVGKLKNPFKGGGLGVEGKLVGKVCQQAKW